MTTPSTITRSRRLPCRTLLVALIGFIFPLSLVHAATDAVTTHPNTAYSRALIYLTAHPDTAAKTADDLAKADDFKKFLTDQGLKAEGRMAGSIATLVVNLATAANDEGIVADPSKPAFQALVQEAAAQKLNVSVATLQGTATPTAAGGKTTAADQAGGGGAAPATATGDKTASVNDVTAIVNAALKSDTPADFSHIQSYFHAGVTLIAPYHIDTTKTPLTIAPASSTDVNAYLEFVYSNRWAWNEQRRENVIPMLNKTEPAERMRTIFTSKDFADVLDEIDLEGRVGYTFASGSSPTANTLAGSGNFNARVSVEAPLVLFRANNDDSAFSFGLEAAASAVTERANLRVHPSKFFGMSYTTSFKDPFGTKEPANLSDPGQAKPADGSKLPAATRPRRVLVHLGLGWATVDSVKYVSDTSNEIFSINNNLPRYFKTRTNAFETELLYPVKSSTYITFTSQVYPQLNPGLWNIQIGVTTSFAELMNTFFK